MGNRQIKGARSTEKEIKESRLIVKEKMSLALKAQGSKKRI